MNTNRDNNALIEEEIGFANLIALNFKKSSAVWHYKHFLAQIRLNFEKEKVFL